MKINKLMNNWKALCMGKKKNEELTQSQEKPKEDCVISWGAVFYDVRQDKLITHNVVSISFDSFDNRYSMVNVSIQKGTEVRMINLSMEHAQDIGFINVNALKKYCNF